MDDTLQYDLDAEKSVLGALIADSTKAAKVCEIVSHEDFYDRRHELIFRGVEWLTKQNIEVDLITLHDALKKAKVIDDVGGGSYLTELTNYVPTALHILNYAKIVADYSARRKINKIATEMSDLSANGESLEETLIKVRDKISEVNHLGGKQNKYQVASMLDYIDDAQERFDKRGLVQGLSTGFPSIDKLTLGLVGGELIIIAGQTSRGKTLLSMNIANNVAKTGKTILFITLEMTHAELTSRYMFVNGGAHTEDFGNVAINTLFQANDELDWRDIDGLIQNAREELGVDLVVIDHLHYFTRELQNVAEDLGRITKEFKKNAIRYDIPIILISHVRKMNKDEKLSGESLRGSSLIAQDADIVLMVDRDPKTNRMGVMVDKNRNRGKLSDRTKDWKDRNEREINTIFLDFNNTKLHDPLDVPKHLQQIFPGAKSLLIEEK